MTGNIPSSAIDCRVLLSTLAFRSCPGHSRPFLRRRRPQRREAHCPPGTKGLPNNRSLISCVTQRIAQIRNLREGKKWLATAKEPRWKRSYTELPTSRCRR
jgi:hypothetical protein